MQYTEEHRWFFRLKVQDYDEGWHIIISYSGICQLDFVFSVVKFEKLLNIVLKMLFDKILYAWEAMNYYFMK